MAELSWPSPDNGRAVDEIQYEQMSAHYTEDGVYLPPSTSGLDPISNYVYADSTSPVNVKVKAGLYANVRGFGWTSGDSPITVNLTANSSGKTRKDRIVLELNRSTWNVRLKAVAGTPGSSSLPALTRNEGPTGVFQVPLATVTVASGAASIPAANVVLDGLRVGSRIRAWRDIDDMFNGYPKLGEIGFSKNDGIWVGNDGSAGLVSIYEDTGWVDLTPPWDTWSKVATTRCRAKNGMVLCSFQLERVKSAFYANDEDGSMILNMPDSFGPSAWEYSVAQFTNGATARVQVRSNGEVWVQHVSKDVPAGRFLRGSIAYHLF